MADTCHLGCERRAVGVAGRTFAPSRDTAEVGTHLNCMETPTPSAARSPLLPAFALAEHLEALARLLDRVSDAGYVAHPAHVVTTPAPISAHVRHCVEHALALLDRPGSHVMTYDDGHGDATLERDRRQAIAALRGLAARVRDMAPRTADVPITVETPLDRLGTRTRIRSSLGRELIFVLQQVSAAERVTEARCAS
jgi:hypothetical protein